MLNPAGQTGLACAAQRPSVRKAGGQRPTHPRYKRREAAETGCLPIAEHTRCPGPIQGIQCRHVPDITQRQNLRRAVSLSVSQHSLQPVAPAVNIG